MLAGNWGTGLDANTWTALDQNDFFDPATSEFYDPANANVSNGVLYLKAEQRSDGGMPYASGAVSTKGKKAYKFGSFIFDVILPCKGDATQQGLWPAIWMLPADGSMSGNVASNEIDIVEAINSPSDKPGTIVQTFHNGSQGDSTTATIATPDAVHRLALTWTPTALTWFVDGVQTKQVTQNVPQEAMYLIIDLAVGVGPDWQPLAPPSSTVFPVNFVVQNFWYEAPSASTTTPTPVATPVGTSQLDKLFAAIDAFCAAWTKQ